MSKEGMESDTCLDNKNGKVKCCICGTTDDSALYTEFSEDKKDKFICFECWIKIYLEKSKENEDEIK